MIATTLLCNIYCEISIWSSVTDKTTNGNGAVYIVNIGGDFNMI